VSPLYWVVLGSTVLSGFFSLTAFALRSFRRVGLDEAFGPENQQKLEYLERNLNALRLTAALCRVIANLVLVICIAWILEATRSFWRAAGAVAIAGAIIAVFSVAIPNAWATHAGEKVLPVTLRALILFRYLLYPLTVIMESLDLPIRRLSGVSDTQNQNGEQAKQEIMQVATEGQAEGTVEPEEVQMIESVMEFGETQAAEIMTPRTDIFALPIDTPWDEAVTKVVEAGHTRVPVYEENMDRIVGILYAKDMLKHISGRHPASIRGMLRKCYFVPETKPLDELLKEFKGRKVHLAIVLDEYGGTAGLVSIEDVVEEIVGDIADEYDETAPAAMKRIDSRSAEIDGRLYVDELNDAMGLELPEDEDYDTVAGLVFSQLGYIPKKGETLETRGAKFTVLSAGERKITRLRVELREETGDEEE
jgi:putative hemolysin